MQRKIKILFEELTPEEIASSIPADVMERIKRSDEHPIFKAFCIGHTGMSTGTIAPGIPISIAYFTQAIRQIAEKIKSGLPLFFGHPKQGRERERIGEVVARKYIETEGGARSIIIGYIHPAYQNKSLDIASIEGDIIFDLDEKGKAKVKKVENINGIALGSSLDGTLPGFPGATILGAFQAFQKNPDKGEIMTLAEIKEAIEGGGLTPSDLFGSDELLMDKTVKESITKAKLNAQGYGTRKEKELLDKQAEWAKEKETFEQEITTQKIQIAKHSVKPIFTEIIGKRKLDAIQKRYIDKVMPGFVPKSAEPEEIKKEINEYLNGELAKFEDLKQIISPETPKPETPAEGTSSEKNPLMPNYIL